MLSNAQSRTGVTANSVAFQPISGALGLESLAVQSACKRRDGPLEPTAVYASSELRNGVRRAQEIGIRIAMKCIDMWYPSELSRPIGTLEASALPRMQIAVSGSLSARC